MIKTKEFSEIVGVSYHSVRQAYKAEAITPRHPGQNDVDFVWGAHRRFVVSDVLAWALTTALSNTGATWEQAATVVRASSCWAFDRLRSW